MAFSRLRALLERKSMDVPALDQLDRQKKATEIWEKKGITLFPENLQEHLKKSVRITSIRNGQAIIQVSDSKTATVILTQRQHLQELFSSVRPQEPVERVIIHQN